LVRPGPRAADFALRAVAAARLPAVVLAAALVACGGGAAGLHAGGLDDGPAEAQARRLLAFYDPVYLALYEETARAAWAASTDVSELHTGERTGAATAMAAFAGNRLVIERARALLRREAELEPVTARQLRQMLVLAADAPQTRPDLARRRVAAEARQAAVLDGFQFCLAREGDRCTRPVITNDLDRILEESRDLAERERAWNAAKEVGFPLREGLLELRELRNGVAREMGYPDFFAFQVSNYGMTSDEMMALLDRLVQETRPLFEQLHCYARYELGARYGVARPPALLPAHWVGNRWAQEWPGLVEGVQLDALLADKEPEWIVRQAERFYTSLGYPALPASFYERSDLYPVPADGPRRKNAHASAWHMDLDQDVRSLMSVEPNWRWFTTTHHELGHIYYYLTYARPEVPPLLREGANRSFHEGMGDLVGLAASQLPYLREIGLLPADAQVDETRFLLDSALTGPLVFLPWSAGTMSHFEKALYADGLPESELNARWWELVARYQGVAPPGPRPAGACDACTKTHIIDDPAQYYDYALANVLVYQLHEHVCRRILGQDPRSCNYYGRREVGEFLRRIMAPGMTRDWREVLREAVGADLSAEPMLRYYAPLDAWLRERNRGRDCRMP
jgi:peptidyl-dipeptidase A